MDNYILKIEFGDIAELRKEKYNPLNSENRKCIELEHINKIDGSINGYIDSINQKSIKNIFHKGDVLFGKLRPYLRKYWLAKFDGVCSTEIWVLKPKKEVCSDSQYLFNLVQSHDFLQAASISSGSKMPRADWKYIVNYPLSIVNSFPEQKAIAQILTTWDKAIETQQLLIEKYKLKKKGLMQKLLAPKEDWKEVRLGDLGSFSKGKGITKSQLVEIGFPAIRYGELYTQHNIFIKKFKSYINQETARYSNQIKQNDILFAGSGETLNEIGKCATYLGDEIVYAGGDIIILSPNPDIDSLYLSYSLNSDIVLRQRRKLGQGHSVVHIYSSGLETLKIRLPIFLKQTKIANILSSADKEIELLEKQLDKLKEQKKGLMQVLLTGKIRVKYKNN